MAKRKRLTPANPMFGEAPAPETKSFSPAPPIAGVAAAASAAAALQELSDSVAEARALGRMVVTVPLATVALDHLVRDRMALDEGEMEALKASLRARGQQTPVELTDLGGGRYGLISGWRRCTALKALHTETGEDRFGHVLGLLRQPAEASDAYVAMVEENEIRASLSHYERARIVLRATERGVFGDTGAALRALFASASRPRRSKIGSFVTVVQALDGALRFPQAIPERLGLALAKALEEDATRAPRLRAALEAAAPDSAEAEQALIQRVMKGDTAPRAKPARLSDGPVTFRENGLNQVVLGGPGLTPALRQALRAWLQANSGGVS